MKEAFRRLWANKTAKILLVAGAALVLLLVSWLVFGREETRATSGFVQTEQEERLAAILSEVEDAGNVSVMITQEGGVPVSAIVMFDGLDGILVRLPLPPHICEKKMLMAIDPAKDVDGFHPYNAGALACGEPGFVPCTPAGIIQLLKRSDISISGKECVVVGRSNIVGKPVAQLLLRENGTVTIAHSKTERLKEVTSRAQILVVAVGQPEMITREYVRPGAVVIDVGIHRDENNKLCGDVDFADVFDVAGAITPVPGGVGPMTIAMLMHNCLEGARRSFQNSLKKTV